MSKYDDVEVYATRRSTREFGFEDTTTVYQRGYSDTFHADKRCPHILSQAKLDRAGLTDREKVVFVSALPLPQVMSSYTDPVKACQHCTQPMMETARVAVQQDGLPAYRLEYFERGQKRVNTRIRRTPAGETEVQESVQVIE